MVFVADLRTSGRQFCIHVNMGGEGLVTEGSRIENTNSFRKRRQERFESTLK